MSNLHADTVAYVRDTMLPEREPPASTVGFLGWGKENLFTGPFNTIVTVLCTLFVGWVLWSILPWVFTPTWNAASLKECQAIIAEMGRDGGHFAGACWGVIRDRWVQLLFGFYPSDLYWRPLLALALLVPALFPVLFTQAPRKLLWFSVLYPFLFPWLLWGGAVWAPLLVIASFVLAFAAYKITASASSSLLGIIVSVVVAVVCLVWGVSLVSGSIERVLGAARYESRLAEARENVATLTPEAERLEGERDALAAQIAERLASVDVPEGEGDGSYLALINDLADERAMLADLASEKAVVDRRLSTARTFVRQMESLPEWEAELPELRAEAEALRAAVPGELASIRSEQQLESYLEEIAEDDSLEAPAPEAVTAVEDAIEAEESVGDTERAIQSTYKDISRIGLETVGSRDFGGMMVSVTIGVVAIACSLPLGIVLALGRQSDLLIVKSLCVGFIEFIRGVPLITLLFVASTLLNIFLPPGTSFDIILRVIIMATLFASAYMAEVIRGGLAALPKGQYEGADSLGLDYWQAQRLIIMPQALKISIPGIVSTFIGLFKDTVLVSVIGILDPLGLSNSIRADQAWNGVVWELYGFIAVMFFIPCFAMSRYSMYLERRLQTGHR